MLKERLIQKGKLYQLEEERKTLSAKARAGLYVLRGVFSDVDLVLDPSRFTDIDMEMVMAVTEDLKSLQNRYREITSQLDHLKEDL